MNNKQDEIILDVKKLNDAQKRIVCNLNAHLLTLLTTSNEGDYFQNTLELFKSLRVGLKNAKFVDENQNISNIPYEQQVLEYSMDFLNDSLHCVDH